MTQLALLIIAGIFGLCIGSFLNVVIYRLPLILQQQWRNYCMEFLNLPQEKSTPIFNLSLPRSHCPDCKKTIPFWHNIPLLSYLILLGKCNYCQRRISWKYPLIECLSGFFAVFSLFHFGWSWQALFAVLFSWSLLTLFFIDLEHQLLPDEITLGLLWLGLIATLWHLFVTPTEAIIGVCAGYGFFWLIGWAFKKIRRIEGIGHGDYKLLAMLGAWCGWQLLPFIVISASLAGCIIGITLLSMKRIGRQTPIAFGPYLCIAGWLAFFYGQNITNYFTTFLLR